MQLQDYVLKRRKRRCEGKKNERLPERMRIRKLRGTAILNIYTYYRYIHTIHAYTVYII